MGNLPCFVMNRCFEVISDFFHFISHYIEHRLQASAWRCFPLRILFIVCFSFYDVCLFVDFVLLAQDLYALVGSTLTLCCALTDSAWNK